jgi:RNA polymerase sigma-70 factor (ECF subfamily)
MMEISEAAQAFEPLRRRLTGLAYRMLGSLADAEDIVQEAYVRWHGADRTSVADPRAYLSRVVTRLCLDQLRSARARRETYVGPWLPEPVLDETALAADALNEYADDLSIALMLTLERLSPLERAAFLLHDVFDVDFPEIAQALERTEAACRQLAARARAHVREQRPRFAPSANEVARLVGAFFAAVRAGDLPRLKEILAEDAVFHTDGGGKRNAALNPIRGRDKIIRFLAGLAKKRVLTLPQFVLPTRLNGMPGFIFVDGEGQIETLVLDILGERIAALYGIRNPNKLARISAWYATIQHVSGRQAGSIRTPG